MKPTRQNTLYLTIKQVFFDEIIAGTKTKEYREIKNTTYKKYLECDEDGFPYYDLMKAEAENPLLGDLCIWNNGVYPYVAKNNLEFLSLAVGYRKQCDTAIVEVNDITFEPITNDDGKPCRFSDDFKGNVKGDENGDFCFWYAVFHLGEVVDVHRN